MVTLSLKVTGYALRWLPGRGNAIVPVATSPPSDTRIVQIFLLKHFFSIALSLTGMPASQRARSRGGESAEQESRAGPAAGGRMAPERTQAAQVQVCLHASGGAHESIKISTTPGTLKTVTSSLHTRVITVECRQKPGVMKSLQKQPVRSAVFKGM